VSTLEELRLEFDRAFAGPERIQSRAFVRLIAIRAREHALALRIGELKEIARCPRIAPIPSAAPGLLGIAGLRGEILGLYSLAALVGGRSASAGPWVARVGRSIGLVFDEIVGSIEIAPDADAEVVRLDGTPFAVIDLLRIAKNLGGNE
jgi:chemotaxis signal transduction protein